MNPIITKAGKTSYPLKRILRKICINIQESIWIPNKYRIKILRLGGVKIGNKSFIGSNVTFDSMHPELIEIGEHVKITSGTKILSHFYNPDNDTFNIAKVTIANDVFIGMNTLIVNPVSKGQGSVIAAGSVVNKDIPENEIWGGNPVKFIRKRKL